MGSKLKLPEDGCLRELPNSGSEVQACNLIIVEVPDEIKELGELNFLICVSDTNKEEEEEWPADRHLEKLIPGLPKTNVPGEKSKATEINTVNKCLTRRKFRSRPVKNESLANHRSKPPRKKFRSNVSKNQQMKTPSIRMTNDIDPWLQNPWENQTYYSESSTVTSVNTSPIAPNIPLGNLYATSPPSQHFTSGLSSNLYNSSNNNAHKSSLMQSGVSNIPLLNNHIGHLTQSPQTNNMPCGTLPFLSPNRFPSQHFTHPSRGGFHGLCPAPKVGFSNSSLLGEPPGARCNMKPGLLGDRPSPNVPFNINLTRFPNSTALQPSPNRNGVTFVPKNIETRSDQNSFIPNAKNSLLKANSYDTGYHRMPKDSFDQYKDNNEIQWQDSNEFYDYPNNTDNSRNNSCKSNHNMFDRSANALNHYENHYNGVSKQLDFDHPNKNIISLKSSRDNYTGNYRRFKSLSTSFEGDSLHHGKVDNDIVYESYNESQTSNRAKRTPFRNDQGQRQIDKSYIHTSQSSIGYKREDFQNEEYHATSINYKADGANQNSASRSNNRQNAPAKRALWKNKQGFRSKFANNRTNRTKYNQGQRKFRYGNSSRK